MTDKVQLIKEEIERLINDKTDGEHVAKADITAPKRSAYLDILNFIDSLPEEPVSEDLEEATSKYVGEDFHERSRADFKAGAEWQKQQMMKDAVEATIFSELKDSDGSLFQAKSDRFRMNGVKISDRIKVIPIKPEQQ